MRGPDYIVEIGGKTRPGPQKLDAPALQRDRAWLAIYWRCCSAYSRIYRNQDSTAYDGCCPRCAKPVHIPIATRGTDHRFFAAS